MKVSHYLAIAASTCAFSAWGASIPFSGAGSCPTAITINSSGTSFPEGVKFTLDVKNMITAKPTIEVIDAQTIQFRAPMKRNFGTCLGKSARFNLFNSLNYYEILISQGEMFVRLHTESLRVDLTSVFNNQVIFKVSENL